MMGLAILGIVFLVMCLTTNRWLASVNPHEQDRTPQGDVMARITKQPGQGGSRARKREETEAEPQKEKCR